MRALVTGVAGFIGSTLAESLLRDHHDVIGVDGFTDYYDVAIKRRNLTNLLAHQHFTFVEEDLRTTKIEPLLYGADVVFHLAAQPGVRRSWDEFETYVNDNVFVTHRLLAASTRVVGLERFVYASSSSVYGDTDRYPVREEDPLRPHSPYGVTKLSGEQLCVAYAENFHVPTVSLRYFTVYGPRQRPDMAFNRACHAALTGTPFPLYGDGSARRDFTFVDDVVRATRRAGDKPLQPGTILNVAGVTDATMTETLEIIGELAGKPVEVELGPRHPGDVKRTGGSIDRATALLGWEPEVSLRDGLAQQIEWHRREQGA